MRCKLLGFRLDYLPKVVNFNLEDARPVGNLEPRLQEILLPLKAIAEGDSTMEATLDEFIKGNARGNLGGQDETPYRPWCLKLYCPFVGKAENYLLKRFQNG